MRTTDNKHLRVWCTTSPTDIRLTTLMHDAQYRAQNCCQQSAYNQPPHPSFFLGTGYSLPARPKVTVLGEKEQNISDGKLIKAFSVNDKSNYSSWSIQSGLSIGNEVFGDRNCKFTYIPESLIGEEWIRTSCNSKMYSGDEASFTASKDITAYIGIDTRAEASAAWLGSWTKTDMTMIDDGSPNVTYNVYKKDVKKNEQVTLGAVNMSQAVNYVVIVKENIFDTENEFIYGDLNGDGVVNVADMIIMKHEVKKQEYDYTSKYRADVDANGKIDNTDVLQLQYFLSKRSELPAVKEKRMFVYASDQDYSEGIKETINSGFRNDSYINLDNKIGSNITWRINAPISGNYLCTFGTANGSTNNRKMKVEVNGKQEHWVQDFLTTGSWTDWQERGIVLPLKKGSNSIVMTSLTEQGGPNLDYLHIEWTDEPIAEIYTEQKSSPQPVLPQNQNRTIYIAGDSTVQTYKSSYAPQQGWGAYLQEKNARGYSGF